MYVYISQEQDFFVSVKQIVIIYSVLLTKRPIMAKCNKSVRKQPTTV